MPLEPLSLLMTTAPEHFINEVNVTKAFQSLKLKSSSGPDGPSNLSLKYAAKELSTVFTDLFQLSISTGVLPDSWRTTRITPLPKKSSTATSPKLHPIACSPVPLKVLESLVLNSIGSFTTRLSDSYQFAYKAKRSTLHAVSWLTHAINAHLDKGCKAFKAVLLDFSNAFNTLPRQGLLDKFAATNPSHWLMKWVHNYLTGRRKYIRVENKTFSVIPNNCGVLQDAVL